MTWPSSASVFHNTLKHFYYMNEGDANQIIYGQTGNEMHKVGTFVKSVAKLNTIVKWDGCTSVLASQHRSLIVSEVVASGEVHVVTVVASRVVLMGRVMKRRVGSDGQCRGGQWHSGGKQGSAHRCRGSVIVHVCAVMLSRVVHVGVAAESDKISATVQK